MDWTNLNNFIIERLNRTDISLHHAAQFVAMFGNSFLPKAGDDSQSNLNWKPESQTILGRSTNHPVVIIGLDVPNFHLVVNTEKDKHRIPLDNQSKTDIIDSVRAILNLTGLDAQRYQAISHFKLPDHELDKKARFVKPGTQSLRTWADIRTVAQRKLEKIAGEYEFASEVRIWPHHFDTGIYIPLEKDTQGNDLKSIGLGLAMADGTVSEPYFYINHWSHGPVKYDKLPKIKSAGYWVTDGWTGLILPVSKGATLDAFFQEGIQATISLL